MAEKIIDLLNKISAIRGEAYVHGMMDAVNLFTPAKEEN